jgi:hypothetical protein
VIQQAVAKYGVRGLARELGLSPGYVSMLASGQRAMTREVGEVIEELVNSQSVHSTVPDGESNSPATASIAGGPDRTRTCDQSIMSRRL